MLPVLKDLINTKPPSLSLSQKSHPPRRSPPVSPEFRDETISILRSLESAGLHARARVEGAAYGIRHKGYTIIEPPPTSIRRFRGLIILSAVASPRRAKILQEKRGLASTIIVAYTLGMYRTVSPRTQMPTDHKKNGRFNR